MSAKTRYRDPELESYSGVEILYHLVEDEQSMKVKESNS